MTPHAVAHRIAFHANQSAAGDATAKAELCRALPALEHFDDEIAQVFVGALYQPAVAYLLAEHANELERMNQNLSVLLTERCVP